MSIDPFSCADGSEGSPNPSRIGRRRFIAATGAIAGASVVGAALPTTTAHAVTPGASQFVILPAAVRLVDTRRRAQYDYVHYDDRRIRVKVGGRAGVPDTATAVVLTATAVNFGQPGHVTVYPWGQPIPVASNLNLRPNSAGANMVTVKLGSDGWVGIASHSPGHKIVDVLGYYVPVSAPVSEGRFINHASPHRVFDSRRTGRPFVTPRGYTTIDVTSSTPADASAVMINLTVANPQGLGHFTAVPMSVSGAPSTSSVNVSGYGDTRAAGVVVPISTVGGRRLIKVYAHVTAHVIVDVFGYYTSTTSSLSETGLFVPITPMRLKDTRQRGQIGRLWPAWVVEVALPSSIRTKASAVAINITGAATRAAGHFTVSGARLPIPNTSNVNWTYAGATVANHAVTTVTAPSGSFPGGFQVYSSHGGHVVADLAGYFVGVPRAAQLGAYVNPPPPPAPPIWEMHVPRLGVVSYVLEGNPYAVTNSGYSWHWAGTGYLGQQAHVSLFAHRTEHGGAYRNIHLLQPGDSLRMVTSDRREFTYQMVRRDLVWGPSRYGPGNERILAATRLYPGTTLSLIACSRTDWLPTSLNHRIVVTFALVSWREF